MSSAREGLARSLQAKLSQHAKYIGADPNLVLTRYAVERYLYRLSRSAHIERFVLKGALLMFAWMGDTFRATRDADLLGIGDVSPEFLAKIFAEVCGGSGMHSWRKTASLVPRWQRQSTRSGNCFPNHLHLPELPDGSLEGKRSAGTVRKSEG